MTILKYIRNARGHLSVYGMEFNIDFKMFDVPNPGLAEPPDEPLPQPGLTSVGSWPLT